MSYELQISEAESDRIADIAKGAAPRCVTATGRDDRWTADMARSAASARSREKEELRGRGGEDFLEETMNKVYRILLAAAAVFLLARPVLGQNGAAAQIGNNAFDAVNRALRVNAVATGGGSGSPTAFLNLDQLLSGVYDPSHNALNVNIVSGLPCSGDSNGAIACTATGTNQNINLVPSGSGTVNVTGSATANQFLQLPSANDGTTSNFPNLGTLYIRATPVMDASNSGGWHYNYTGDPWVFEDGGQYYMYFYGATSGGTLAAGYATSDNLLNWTEYGSNPVFNPGSGYDADDVVKPSIIKIGSTYYAYCQVQDGSGVMRIGLFTASSPGGPWTDHGSAVISTGSEPGGYTTDAIEAPVVYQNGSTYYLYYMAQLTTDNRWETFYATSTDGINWTHQGLAIPFGASGRWDQGCIAPGRIIRVGSYYVMAANGCNSIPTGASLEGNPGGIGIFYSTDLANWTEYSLDPVVPASTYWGPYRANLINAHGTIWMLFNMKGVYWTGARATATAERIYAARFGAPFPDGNMTTDGTVSYVSTTLGLGQPPLSPPTGGGTIYHQMYVTNPPGENHGAGIEVYDHGQPTFISSGDPNTGHIWSFSMRTDSTYQLFYNSDGTTGGWHEYFLFDTHGDLISLPVSFSVLPACSSSTEGATRPVTDSTVNTWGATVTGGGSNHVEAYCDGTNWTVAAK